MSMVDALSANEGRESFVLGREEQSDAESESETTLFDLGRPSSSDSSRSREGTRAWGCEGRRGYCWMFSRSTALERPATPDVSMCASEEERVPCDCAEM